MRLRVEPSDPGPVTCLEALDDLDRLTRSSAVGVGVASRYEAVEELLDRVWNGIVQPHLLSRTLRGEVRVRMPQRLIRLPIATARCAATGESLVHLSESVLEWPQLGRRPCRGVRTFVRLDGHHRAIAERLPSVRVESEVVLLLMGCRTAMLVPMLRSTGAGGAIVTSWDVEDRHCESIGAELEGLLEAGFPGPQALRSVQALRSSRHPYEWAGYSYVDLTDGAVA